MKRVRLVRFAASVVCILGALVGGYKIVNAEGEVSMIVSPLREGVILSPGDTYKGAFKVSNPADAEVTIEYDTEILPFYVDENYDPVYNNDGGNGDMAKWITITDGATGRLKPNEAKTIEFKIDVPETAAGGGQYAAIIPRVQTTSGEGEGLVIGESIGIAHVVFAEITGETVVSGDILNAGLLSFIIDGKITGYSTVENTGNVHGQAVYKLKVYPLFSDTPIYSNEEMPEDHYVLPGRKLNNETTWSETPQMGIFNVVYAIEFQGITNEVRGVVVVCPWWLIVLFAIGLILMILRIVTLVKLSKKPKAAKEQLREVDK